VLVDPVNPKLTPPRSRRLKLRCVVPLSEFAFKFNLRRYIEVSHGAATLGLSTRQFLARLRDAGLGSLPGTAAEVLDDAVRAELCPDKLTAAEWLDVVADAHAVGPPGICRHYMWHNRQIEIPRHMPGILGNFEGILGITGRFREILAVFLEHADFFWQFPALFLRVFG